MSLTEELFTADIPGLTEDYKLISELNTGFFARVYKVEERKTKQEYACKLIQWKNLTEKQRSNVLEEVRIMKMVKHERIVQFKEFIQTDTYYIIIMELMRGGDLFDKLQENDFTEAEARGITRQVAEAVHYLHEIGIAHRDIKLENLMFVNKDECAIKLGDFGLARYSLGNPLRTYCGTTEYMAPEVLKGGYTFGVDIWALGCLVYILLFGVFPFYDDLDNSGNPISNIYQKVQKGEYSFPRNKPINDKAKDLIQKCLVVDPEKRINIREFLAHPWMKMAPLHTSGSFNSPRTELRTLQQMGSLKDFFKIGIQIQIEKANSNSTDESERLLAEMAHKSLTLSPIESSSLVEKRKSKKLADKHQDPP